MKNIFFVIFLFLPTLVFGISKPLTVINLESHPGGTHMMTMMAKVNGHEGRFMFDTGGGITYISPGFATEIGCEPWGQLSGFVLTGQRLDLQRCESVALDVAGRHLALPTAGVYDIGQFMPKDAPRIDGSIGLDAFVGQVVTLSLAKKKLIVESASSLKERQKKGKEIKIRLVRELEGLALAVVAAVQTNKGLAWMELDSGNGGAHVIGKHLATMFGLDPEKKEPQNGRITLQNGITVDGPFRVNPTLIMDGNIGTRFLINYDLTIDLAKGRGWLSSTESR
jgi:hypothetical protein